MRIKLLLALLGLFTVCRANDNLQEDDIDYLNEIQQVDANRLEDEIQLIDSIFAKASQEVKQQKANFKMLNLKKPERDELKFYATIQMPASKKSYAMDRYATIMLNAAYRIRQVENKLIYKPTIPPAFCPRAQVNCDTNYRYRSYDGSCNNLKNPLLGARGTPLKRYMKADYDDGLSSPRTKGLNGKTLPSTRLVSETVHNLNVMTAPFSQFLAFIAQFLSHDFGQIPRVSDAEGRPFRCQCNVSDITRTTCFNIEVPTDDPLFKTNPCLPFTRSSAIPDIFKCEIGQREQSTQLTHWLDASQVYGNTVNESASLRDFYQGLMKTSLIPGHNLEFLPFANGGKCDQEPTKPCFEAADDRTEQTPPLTLLHTHYVRYHNRIARGLSKLNPHWDDERLYQEARRIVIAVYQHLIYKEFLPILLGQNAVENNYLLPLTNGYSDLYNELTDGSISNEFLTVSFRLHHLVYPKIFTSNSQFEDIQAHDFNDLVLSRTAVYKDSESFCSGMFIAPSQPSTAHITDAIRSELFNGKNSLSSINMQRARDHGIPSYVAFRRFCGLSVPRAFRDLYGIIQPKALARMIRVYKNVQDIDAWSGSISEIVPESGILGPTSTCIISKQFKELRIGDRFFYDNDDPITRFTPNQLNEIRKSSFARFMCYTTNLKFIQLNPLMLPSEENYYVECRHFPVFNLRPWQEKRRKISPVSVYANRTDVHESYIIL